MNDTAPAPRPAAAAGPASPAAAPLRALAAVLDAWTLALAPLDRARRALWRLGCLFSWSRASVADRSLRLSLVAAFHMLVSFTLTAVAPLWLLLLGPLLLGVPHILSDVRFLLLRPPAPVAARARLAILAALAAMSALRAATLFGGPYLLDAELALGGAAILAGLALTPGRPRLRATLAAATLALTAWGLTAPWEAALTIGHLHNFVAFAYWLVLARDGGPWRRVAAVAALYLALVTAILAGALDPLFTLAWTQNAAGLAFDAVIPSVALPTATPDTAVRLLTLFTFTQAVHYAVWLRLVPQRRSPRRPPPSLARATAELRHDLGAWGLRLAALATLLIPLAALADAPEARRVYLTLALFHGWLELAIFATLLAGRRPAGAPT